MISNVNPEPLPPTLNVSRAAVTLPIMVAGDRHEYWADDPTGVFFAKIPIPPPDEQLVYIKLTNSNSEIVDSLEVPYETTTNEFSFHVDLTSLGDDEYTIEIETYGYHYTAGSSGGVTISGESAAEIIFVIYKYIGGGGLIISGESEAYSPSVLNYEASGGLESGGSLSSMSINYLSSGSINLGGEAIIIKTDSPPETKQSCLEKELIWCPDLSDCTTSVMYKEALIPGITVCRDNETVTDLLK